MIIISIVNSYAALCVRHIYYFWLHWVFVAVRGLSLVVLFRGNSLLGYMGFSLLWLFLLWSTDSRLIGFSRCSTRAH